MIYYLNNSKNVRKFDQVDNIINREQSVRATASASASHDVQYVNWLKLIIRSVNATIRRREWGCGKHAHVSRLLEEKGGRQVTIVVIEE